MRGEKQVQPLDVVALLEDLPEEQLRRGQVGTVIEILSGGKALEVEFCDRNGRTYASLGLRPDQIMVLRYASEEAKAGHQDRETLGR